MKKKKKKTEEEVEQWQCNIVIQTDFPFHDNLHIRRNEEESKKAWKDCKWHESHSKAACADAQKYHAN